MTTKFNSDREKYGRYLQKAKDRGQRAEFRKQIQIVADLSPQQLSAFENFKVDTGSSFSAKGRGEKRKFIHEIILDSLKDARFQIYKTEKWDDRTLSNNLSATKEKELEALLDEIVRTKKAGEEHRIIIHAAFSIIASQMDMRFKFHRDLFGNNLLIQKSNGVYFVSGIYIDQSVYFDVHVYQKISIMPKTEKHYKTKGIMFEQGSEENSQLCFFGFRNNRTSYMVLDSHAKLSDGRKYHSGKQFKFQSEYGQFSNAVSILVNISDIKANPGASVFLAKKIQNIEDVRCQLNVDVGTTENVESSSKILAITEEAIQIIEAIGK